MAYIYPFRMASGTSTMLVIDPIGRRFCNGIRAKSAWVYPGFSSLPGGFMEARFYEESQSEEMKAAREHARAALNFKLVGDEYHEGEDLELCALRELLEELKTKFEREQLNMFAVRSNSRTDTRAHVINACYWLEATPEQIATIEAGDDLEEIEWIDFDAVLEQPMEMAFNHMEVTYQGLRAYLRHKLLEHILSEWDDTSVVEDFTVMDQALAALERQVANG